MQRLRRKFAHSTVAITAAGVLLLLLLTPTAYTTLFLNNHAVLGAILFSTSAWYFIFKSNGMTRYRSRFLNYSTVIHITNIPTKTRLWGYYSNQDSNDTTIDGLYVLL